MPTVRSRTVFLAAAFSLLNASHSYAYCIGLELAEPIATLEGVDFRITYTSHSTEAPLDALECSSRSPKVTVIAIDECTKGTTACSSNRAARLLLSGKLGEEDLSGIISCELDDPDDATLAGVVVGALTSAAEDVPTSGISVTFQTSCSGQ